MKVCPKCKISKDIKEFYSNTKRHPYCKICTRLCDKDYKLRNKEKIILKRQKYEKENKEIIRERKRIRHNFRRKTDINFKLKSYLRTRIYCAIKKNQKVGSAIRDLGCTGEELKQYLESKFKERMSWNNWGNKEGQWSIDHIVPLSSFDLTVREQFLKACHYTNLQPLWHIDNLRKGNRV